MIGPDFGRDWLTGAARDLIKIAVMFGGYDAGELIGRVARAPSRGEFTNRATVARILDDMYREGGR